MNFVSSALNRGAVNTLRFPLAAAAHLSSDDAPCSSSFLICPCHASPWWKLTLITGDTAAPRGGKEGKLYLGVVAKSTAPPATERGRGADSWRAGPAAAVGETRGQEIYGLGPRPPAPPRLQSPPHLSLIDFVSARSHNR